MSHPMPVPPPCRSRRSDGDGARSKLLQQALRLFAQKGFAKTSTRELAQAAGANIGAISYYFGGKAGLYRAALTEPMGDTAADIARWDQPQHTLIQSLQAYYARVLDPLKQGECAQHCTRLHFREMLEPTGLWTEGQCQDIEPSHQALLRVLRRHLGLSGDAQDDDLHFLAVSLAGLAIHLYVGGEVLQRLHPGLLATPEAIDACAQRLALHAHAMVQGEAQRRAHAPFADKETPCL